MMGRPRFAPAPMEATSVEGRLCEPWEAPPPDRWRTMRVSDRSRRVRLGPGDDEGIAGSPRQGRRDRSRRTIEQDHLVTGLARRERQDSPFQIHLIPAQLQNLAPTRAPERVESQPLQCVAAKPPEISLEKEPSHDGDHGSAKEIKRTANQNINSAISDVDNEAATAVRGQCQKLADCCANQYNQSEAEDDCPYEAAATNKSE
jgi:hypothetical protein